MRRTWAKGTHDTNGMHSTPLLHPMKLPDYLNTHPRHDSILQLAIRIKDVYAPSTYTAHQGSSHDIHQYDEYAGAYNRADLLGYQYSPGDSYQRTTDFVDNGQQNRAGGRFAYSDEAEQSGMDNAAEAIQDFDSRFSGTNNANAVAQGAQRGNRSSTRAQRNRHNYAYPGTIDYPTQNGGSRTQR
ncbi:hypothetical protein KAF25_000153 [Fusarium avenaceum]|uniref:Uncharacterized protein n=1 Tax=Fusarium avenaceum TaxID=40199 RepID=A0A9P7KRL6_9HYPO|nr:hypothetical protein KAF25_000153 [Fusarium avenaceum]